MGYLFGQTWIWILIAFVLGLIIGFLLAWVARKKKVEVTEERVGAPAGATDLSSTRRSFDEPATTPVAGFGERPVTAGSGFGAPAAAGVAGAATGSAYGERDWHGRHEADGDVPFERDDRFPAPSPQQTQAEPTTAFEPHQGGPQNFQQQFEPDRPQPPTYSDYRIPGPQDRPSYEPTQPQGPATHEGPTAWGAVPTNESGPAGYPRYSDGRSESEVEEQARHVPPPRFEDEGDAPR